ncbi:hybrid sensor histidine kinase/response regulator [Ramlibacter sp. MMS24-I3-19]|uniref:hybrid sensor histidine kinase/response regulator n=1 Tax=Ramlibacter sp. MMS24-I3-19 TaxID=3416606 RepID=UPI003D02C18C
MPSDLEHTGDADLRAQVAALTAANEQLQRDLQAARDAAQAAARAKDDLLSMLGHELRNPVGAITVAYDVLEAAPPASTEAFEARAILGRQTRNLGRLLADLLDMGRVMAGRVSLSCQPVDLADLVTRVQRTLEIQGATADHAVHVQAQAAWVHGDPMRLEQVMVQLLGNALKYTPAGGRIDVCIAARGGLACFDVRDTGRGIAPGLLPHVFDLFVQGERPLDRRPGGLGIGLPLVRKLVELHGGTVHAESSPQGSCFRVCLPGIAAPDAPDAHGSAAARRRRVLVIEDNTDVLSALRARLELDGHTVFVACDGATGLMRLLQEQPDVSLVDIGLPRLNGLEVARHARAAGYAGRMVALSGYGQHSDVDAARRAGFDDYAVKPLGHELLRRCLGTE